MSTFLDYCFMCERQTAGEVYCSQSCRLADLEASAASSPTSSSHTNSFNSSKRNSTSSSHGLYLPPAFDFSAYRTGSNSSKHTASSYRAPVSTSSRPASSYFTTSKHSRSPSSPKLTPSSSQASLSSLHSTESKYGSTEGISRQARNELREYTNSFDQVREGRRRLNNA